MDEQTEKRLAANSIFSHKHTDYLKDLRQYDLNELLEIELQLRASMRRPHDFTGLSNDNYFADKFEPMTPYPNQNDDD